MCCWTAAITSSCFILCGSGICLLSSPPTSWRCSCWYRHRNTFSWSRSMCRTSIDKAVPPEWKHTQIRRNRYPSPWRRPCDTPRHRDCVRNPARRSTHSILAFSGWPGHSPEWVRTRINTTRTTQPLGCRKIAVLCIRDNFLQLFGTRLRLLFNGVSSSLASLFIVGI